MDTIEAGRLVEGVEVEVPSFDYAKLNEARRLRWIQMRVTNGLELATQELIRPTLLSEINTLDRFLSLALFRARKDGQEEATLADINEMKGHLRVIEGSEKPQDLS